MGQYFQNKGGDKQCNEARRDSDLGETETESVAELRETSTKRGRDEDVSQTETETGQRP